MKRAIMDIKGVTIGGSSPVRIMGIINLSPESFYQGSVVVGAEALRNRISTMEKQGVDMIDVGGASTAPTEIYGTSETKEEEELQRVISAMDIINQTSKIPISIDTTSSKVAETALDLGASIVNDVSGLRADPRMARLLAEREVPIVLMARCPDGCKSVDLSYQSLKESIRIAMDAGVKEECLILDPGIGFGKPFDIDLMILKELKRYMFFQRPLLVGVSRKAFIGHLLDDTTPDDRLTGTIAATSLAVANGADIIRAHDVPEACIAAKIGRALRDEPLIYDNLEIMQLTNDRHVELVLENVGVGDDIRTSLAKKGVLMQILVKEMQVPAALIVKQEMLTLGGDAAYHYDTIDHAIDRTSVLIMGTKKQLIDFSSKIARMDYFGLKEIGKQIKSLLT